MGSSSYDERLSRCDSALSAVKPTWTPRKTTSTSSYGRFPRNSRCDFPARKILQSSPKPRQFHRHPRARWRRCRSPRKFWTFAAGWHGARSAWTLMRPIFRRARRRMTKGASSRGAGWPASLWLSNWNCLLSSYRWLGPAFCPAPRCRWLRWFRRWRRWDRCSRPGLRPRGGIWKFPVFCPVRRGLLWCSLRHECRILWKEQKWLKKVNQSINQSTNQSINRRINQSINQSIHQSID